MKVVNHRLVNDDNTPVAFHPSPNFTNQVIQPKYLVIHYTAGRTAEGAIAYLSLDRGQNSVSAHIVIGRDGTVTQLVDFNKIAWHAGISRWEGLEGMNRYSIGIELDNAGKLEKVGEKWQSWFKMEVPAEDIVEAAHKNDPTRPGGWHNFTEAQIEAALQVGQALFAGYQLLDVVGHDDIAPTRKVDPGPAFPMQSFRARLTGRRADDPIYYEVTADELNIREGPGTGFAPLANALAQGTRVEELRTSGNWWFVRVVPQNENEGMDLEGWVHSYYLKRLPPQPPQ